MFNHIRALLTGESQPASAKESTRLQIAVAALLVQAATMDDTFDAAERASIERVLAARFSLDGDTVRRLLAAAEDAAERSNQLYSFVRVVVEQLTPQDRVGIVEMMWEVAYADGVLDPDEDALLRRVAGLLYVSDYDRGAARKRVLQRISVAGRNGAGQDAKAKEGR
ncbi:MAG TPA: TerB family tellurite resistance protein [Alphaproteobacteria bacterium]|nr:TerB family tellurite resistance protein [Alphaproteobacteria bacterium]